MALNLPTFYKRTGSAIVFAIIMLAGLLWNDLSFLALMLLIDALCLREYFKLMQQINTTAYWPAWLPVAVQAIAAALVLLTYGYTAGGYAATAHTLMVVVPAVTVVVLLAGVLPVKSALEATMQAIGGLLYITAAMCMLLLMHHENSILPIALILMIWCNDTMAYLVGSFIGKTPFSPISPKKTWEGTAGGALLTVAGAAVYGYFSQTFGMADWIALALCAAVAGTLGDLLESKLKRMAGVKDSGAIMPGHGGALDRFDSLLIAAPFAGVWVLCIMKCWAGA